MLKILQDVACVYELCCGSLRPEVQCTCSLWRRLVLPYLFIVVVQRGMGTPRASPGHSVLELGFGAAFIVPRPRLALETYFIAIPRALSPLQHASPTFTVFATSPRCPVHCRASLPCGELSRPLPSRLRLPLLALVFYFA